MATLAASAGARRCVRQRHRRARLRRGRARAAESGRSRRRRRRRGVRGRLLDWPGAAAARRSRAGRAGSSPGRNRCGVFPDRPGPDARNATAHRSGPGTAWHGPRNPPRRVPPALRPVGAARSPRHDAPACGLEVATTAGPGRASHERAPRPPPAGHRWPRPCGRDGQPPRPPDSEPRTAPLRPRVDRVGPATGAGTGLADRALAGAQRATGRTRHGGGGPPEPASDRCAAGGGRGTAPLRHRDRGRLSGARRAPARARAAAVRPRLHDRRGRDHRPRQRGVAGRCAHGRSPVPAPAGGG